MQPINPLQYPRFSGIVTFSRLPMAQELKKPLDIGILGIPFDGGTSFRPGSRFAPRSIREASVLCRNFNSELGVSVYDTKTVADLGDVVVNPLNLQATFKNIEDHLNEVFKQKTKVISLGGDHSILLPILRTIKKHHGDFTLIQFDAHTDTADQAWGEKYHHGTPVRRAIEEGLVNGNKIFQIGIRGPLTSANQNDFDIQNGIHKLPMCDFYDSKKKELFFNLIKKTSGNKPVYLTFDVDGVDPAFAPGTGTPVIGGMTSHDALTCIRELKGLNIVGADVVEVSPAYDHAEITSLLAAGLVFEFLSLMALA